MGDGGLWSVVPCWGRAGFQGLGSQLNCWCVCVRERVVPMFQSVLRASARLIFRKRKFDSISLEIRDKLHWLPVRKRIEFKICTTVYKSLHGGAPPYLVEMMLPVTDTPAMRRLRSATRGDLIIPSSKTVRFGSRSFNVSGPTLWNSLPVNIRQCKSFESFKKQLKTFLRADNM